MTRSVLHVDMDAFYASVEGRDHPELKGRPVIVGADPKNGKGRGVVAACSYEARKFGIRSALPISRAWKLCPQAAYVRPRFKRYGEVSGIIMAIFRTYTDLVEPLSIDEAFLDVTGSTALMGPAHKIAQDVKRTIRERTGLTASVGVAPNKFLAKIASDLGKPDGLVIVDPDQVPQFLADLPISRLWGVGPKTETRLRRMGGPHDLRSFGPRPCHPGSGNGSRRRTTLASLARRRRPPGRVGLGTEIDQQRDDIRVRYRRPGPACPDAPRSL